jgi:hypothetical protein
MKPRAYSSLTAFLAHHEALSSARDRRALGSADAAILAVMDSALAELSDAERAALSSAPADRSSADARRRARAELHLAHILDARGLLAA